MKKICYLLPLLLVLTACAPAEAPVPVQPFFGVWITAAEIAYDRDSEASYAEKIAALLEKLRSREVTDIFVQVRPDCDALYPSDIFPVSRYTSALSFDPFAVICEKAKQSGLKIHAWINPYRVSTSCREPVGLPKGSPAFALYKEDEASLLILPSGIYLNPASVAAQKLILDGIREILRRYPVDGIHTDDYFYPPDTGNADAASYEAYARAGGELTLEDWRRENVNALVSGIYSAVKSEGNLLYSVSPSADVEKCRDILFADVERWCAEDGFCDLLIPQIYFGFENSFLPFEKCLSRWLSMCGSERLAPGLALYKQGKTDVYAGDGADEWINDPDVIEKQQALCRENGCGFCLFSSGFFDENS